MQVFTCSVHSNSSKGHIKLKIAYFLCVAEITSAMNSQSFKITLKLQES